MELQPNEESSASDTSGLGFVIASLLTLPWFYYCFVTGIWDNWLKYVLGN